MNDIAFKPKMKMKFYLSETVVNFFLVSVRICWSSDMMKYLNIKCQKVMKYS